MAATSSGPKPMNSATQPRSFSRRASSMRRTGGAVKAVAMQLPLGGDRVGGKKRRRPFGQTPGRNSAAGAAATRRGDGAGRVAVYFCMRYATLRRDEIGRAHV